MTFKENKSHYTLLKTVKNYNTFYKTSVKIFLKLNPIIVSTHKRSKITEENGNVNWPLSFEGCFLVFCVVVSAGARKWVTLAKFECLRGLDFVVGDIWEERGDVWKGNSEERERERKECLEGELHLEKTDIEEREEWKECSGSSKEKNRVMSCKGLNNTVLVKTFPPEGQNSLQCSHQNLGPGPFFFICEQFEHWLEVSNGWFGWV